MRAVFTLLHRWAGLTIAAFLFVSGVTGAVISWDHELDDLINPHLLKTSSSGPRIPPLEMIRSAQEREPNAYATYMVLTPDDDENYEVGFTPRINPDTDEPYKLGFNRIYYDPVSGAEVGRREWGAVWPITRETFVSFLYRLHYTLHIPTMWGTDRWGYWLLGIVAMIWTVDCFVGFYLTLPARRRAHAARAAAVERQLARGFWPRWRPAWKIKTRGSPYRITFDIHRAFGLWSWALLLVVAFTAFSLNLYREVFYPLMATISKVTPSPFTERAATPLNKTIDPVVGYPEILARGEEEATRRGWEEPAGALFYAPRYGVYGVMFFRPGDDHGAAGVGPPMLFYDGRDGRYLGDRQPWKGTAADIFVQAQFPLHSGRILGLPGRILISVMGLVVAALSVTGVVIWYRKRRARIRVAAATMRRPGGLARPDGVRSRCVSEGGDRRGR
jgi:uncharacterized iron-regulated membrane protein